MKSNILVLSILSTALVAASPLQAQNTTRQCTNAQSASQDLNDARCKLHGAARDLKDYTFEEKDAFSAKLKDGLSEANKSLDPLDAKVAHAGAATKEAAQPKLDALRTKADQLGKKVDAIQGATASTWESVKKDSKNSYIDLKVQIHRERQWLSNKLAS